MKKKALFFLLSALTTLIGYSQIQVKGVLISHNPVHSGNDTIIIACMKLISRDTVYYSKNDGNLRPINNINVLNDEIDFWEWEWFKYNSYNFARYGWKIEKRIRLEKQTLDYIASLDQENRIFKDDYVEDYLFQLLKQVHPVMFNKGRNQYFSFKLLNSDEDKVYTFDNGTILISTQTIAECKSEKELKDKIIRSVVHILLDHNLNNTNIFSENILSLLGANYDDNDSLTANLVADSFMKHIIQSNSNNIHSLSDSEFNERISHILSYTAWQEFYSQHYLESLRMINRLIEYDVAGPDDYLLKAKIYRTLSLTPGSLTEALNLLSKADSISKGQLIDVFPEKGILLMRFERWDEALNTFKTYKELLEKQQITGDELKWCDHMEFLCNLHANNKSNK